MSLRRLPRSPSFSHTRTSGSETAFEDDVVPGFTDEVANGVPETRPDYDEQVEATESA
ncbi:hypothetical protein ACFO0N_05210 [Halobium salinum]|uniref:Uncharacterized protein n=1 Tax=Halobium salinum TaxID=1364940 RepID=A0ABD5P9A3_9EURY|nr:hypothetical protein [Halobium salinum]